MRLLIFGATGTVGRILVEQGLKKNHKITAFVRDPSKLEIKHPDLTVIPGDVLDPAAVQNAMHDHDAVLCALGAGSKGVVRAEGTRNILRAMEQAGVKRFICQTSLGVGDSQANLNFFWKYIMFGFLLRKAYQDHELQERLIFQSKVNWTIVRPAAFTNGPANETYRHGFSPEDKNITLKISRADVADFMLKQLTTDTYLKKTPGLSY